MSEATKYIAMALLGLTFTGVVCLLHLVWCDLLVRRTPTRHSGDCTIYSSLINGEPTDGICTCGFGWERVREGNGDYSELYSKERLELLERKDK